MALTEIGLLDHLRETTELNGQTMPDSPLFSSGMLDSVAMLNLIAFIEEASGVEIRAEDVTLDNFDTPARIVRFMGAQAG